MHRRHRLVGRPGRYPRFQREVISFSFEVHVRVVAFGRRESIFLINDVRRPAFRLADATQIALALIISLIHHYDSVRAEFLDQPI